jgi:hypothetical protein
MRAVSPEAMREHVRAAILRAGSNVTFVRLADAPEIWPVP